ncbi:hypothetical protein LA080_013626 [Diaporthe eres]|nr:hypothetical protein LA080_013626 [Diaporthe eres]
MFMTSDVVNRMPMRAFECEFFPTVTTFGGNITNGRLVEHVLSSQRMDVYDVVGDTHSMLLINKTVKDGVWHDCQGLPDPSDDNNTPVISYSQPWPPPFIGSALPTEVLTNKSVDGPGYWKLTIWWPQECAYWLPDQSIAGFSRAMYLLLGNESVGTITDLTGAFTGNLRSVNLWNNGTASLETVQKAMDGLCSAISAQWRTGDRFSSNIGPAIGIVQQNETCIRVNWAWLTLPAAFLFLTVVFFIINIVQTKSMNVWKSSTLAMLFNEEVGSELLFYFSDFELTSFEYGVVTINWLQTSHTPAIFRGAQAMYSAPAEWTCIVSNRSLNPVAEVSASWQTARTGPQSRSAVKSVWLSPYPETPPKPPYPSRTMPAPLVSRFGGGGQLADDLQGQRG